MAQHHHPTWLWAGSILLYPQGLGQSRHPPAQCHLQVQGPREGAVEHHQLLAVSHRSVSLLPSCPLRSLLGCTENTLGSTISAGVMQEVMLHHSSSWFQVTRPTAGILSKHYPCPSDDHCLVCRSSSLLRDQLHPMASSQHPPPHWFKEQLECKPTSPADLKSN